MLLIAKLIALGIMIWFYMSAQKAGEPPVKWAVIGLIGYTIVWFLVYRIVAVPLSSGKAGAADFIIHQIPAVIGLLTAHWVRKKLMREVTVAK